MNATSVLIPSSIARLSQKRARVNAFPEPETSAADHRDRKKTKRKHLSDQEEPEIPSRRSPRLMSTNHAESKADQASDSVYPFTFSLQEKSTTVNRTLDTFTMSAAKAASADAAARASADWIDLSHRKRRHSDSDSDAASGSAGENSNSAPQAKKPRVQKIDPAPTDNIPQPPVYKWVTVGKPKRRSGTIPSRPSRKRRVAPIAHSPYDSTPVNESENGSPLSAGVPEEDDLMSIGVSGNAINTNVYAFSQHQVSASTVGEGTTAHAPVADERSSANLANHQEYSQIYNNGLGTGSSEAMVVAPAPDNSHGHFPANLHPMHHQLDEPVGIQTTPGATSLNDGLTVQVGDVVWSELDLKKLAGHINLSMARLWLLQKVLEKNSTASQGIYASPAFAESIYLNPPASTSTAASVDHEAHGPAEALDGSTPSSDPPSGADGLSPAVTEPPPWLDPSLQNEQPVAFASTSASPSDGPSHNFATGVQPFGGPFIGGNHWGHNTQYHNGHSEPASDVQQGPLVNPPISTGSSELSFRLNEYFTS